MMRPSYDQHARPELESNSIRAEFSLSLLVMILPGSPGECKRGADCFVWVVVASAALLKVLLGASSKLIEICLPREERERRDENILENERKRDAR